MLNNYNLPISILLLFLMLWLPMGQYDFLIDNWMKVGTYAVPFLLIGAFALQPEDQAESLWENYRFIGILFLIAYIIHQFEEHWIDLYGNVYAFFVYNNNFISGIVGNEDPNRIILTKESIFVINTSLVWLVAALGIWRSPGHLFPLMAMGGIIVVNGFVHILAGVATFTYNPGVVTSVLIFLPIYIWFFRMLVRKNAAYRKQLIGGLIWAFLAHVIMVGGLIAANWFNVFPEVVYFAALVLWSCVPVLVYRQTKF